MDFWYKGVINKYSCVSQCMVKKPIDSQGWAHTAHLGLIGLGISPILFSLLHTIISVSFDIGDTECLKNRKKVYVLRK